MPVFLWRFVQRKIDSAASYFLISSKNLKWKKDFYTAICKSQNGDVGNGMRGMMGTQGIKVGMRRIRVGMQEIRVGNARNQVGQGIRVEMQVYKYLAVVLQGFC